MKGKWLWIVILTALLTALSVVPAYAGPVQNEPGVRSDVEKVVFIHYPRGAAAAAGAKPAGPKGSTNCPDPSTCTDYQWSRTKWFSSPSYLLDASASGVDAAVTAAAVQASAVAWTSKTTSLGISGGSGSTDCNSAGTTGNSQNQICWRDLTSSYPNAIAVTFVWYYRSNKQIVEADMVFNNGSGFTWSYTDPGACGGYADCNAATGASGSYDIRNIGTHEFGHFLALLGDLYSPQDSQLTMYGYGATGEVKKDSLGKGDCLGITKAYGGSC